MLADALFLSPLGERRRCGNPRGAHASCVHRSASCRPTLYCRSPRQDAEECTLEACAPRKDEGGSHYLSFRAKSRNLYLWLSKITRFFLALTKRRASLRSSWAKLEQ